MDRFAWAEILSSFLAASKERLMKPLHFGIAIASLLSLATSVFADEGLSADEAIVCQSAEQCVDILARHTVSQFDYKVLAAEMARFPGDSAKGLLTVADDAAGRAKIQRLLGQRNADLNAVLIPMLMLSDQSEHRVLAGHYLSEGGPIEWRWRLPLAPVARFAKDYPSPHMVKLLTTHGPDAAQPYLVSLLSSGDKKTAASAYAALYKHSPDEALNALMDVVGKTDDYDVAKSIGLLLADRFKSTQDSFYQKRLDQLARDPGISEAMRDGARAGLLTLLSQDILFTIDPNIADQIIRIAKDDPEFVSLQLITGGVKNFNPTLWVEVATAVPDIIPSTLFLLERTEGTHAEKAALISVAFEDPENIATLRAGLNALTPGTEGQWTSELTALAQHPFDDIRFLAKQHLQGRFSHREASWSALISNRSPTDYCTRGTPITVPSLAQLPPFEDETLGLPGKASVYRDALTSHYPARTRWLAGYGTLPKFGSLIAYDYADGSAQLLLQGAVDFIVPASPVPLGQHPETLFIFTGGMPENYQSAAVWAIAPDGDQTAKMVTALPAGVTNLFRLNDGSLLLHFHDADTPFETVVRDQKMIRGQNTQPPPLRLSVDGTLSIGCAETAPNANGSMAGSYE